MFSRRIFSSVLNPQEINMRLLSERIHWRSGIFRYQLPRGRKRSPYFFCLFLHIDNSNNIQKALYARSHEGQDLVGNPSVSQMIPKKYLTMVLCKVDLMHDRKPVSFKVE